jgi:ribose/xylose/arabinose/galactoside ABC-type transport system permease subunit
MSATTMATPFQVVWRRMRPGAAVWTALGLFVLFALLVPRFATPGNIANVLRVASILGIAACGQAIALVLGGIEFSFGSSVALGSVVAVLVVPSAGPVAALAAAGGVVAAIGAVNGALIAWFGLPAFIVTLGMLMIAGGAAASLVGGQPVDAPPSDAFAWPAAGQIGGVPAPIVLGIGAVIVLHLLLAKTRLGRAWYLTGANPTAARLSGIRIGAAVFWGYFIAGLFCAVAGIVLTSRVGSGQPNLAPNLPFESIAACAIGGIPLAGGQGRAYQVACGVFVIAMMNNAVVLLNLPHAGQELVIALVIIGAVLLQQGTRATLRRLPRALNRRADQ